ncbi:AI-2E family transporter [Variovorax saccharolyticus]|uniref:AI-2E family transporter n=1 Tax=Variovorax saccharolyticus TaxID=3053516 RepID=UPI002576CE8F|nr:MULTISPECIES: AI-2E family transporter [unclassified Variovorax]MDM0018635.1 AI-2E family transporter [Variovorax sp. J22R187]MDM0024173.1 AI-2E family transporter [Variovorax sp. J31P216]
MSEAAEPAAAAVVETAEPDRVLLHMPVDVRSASLVVLAVLASVFALRWAAAVFIPLMVSLLLTYALAPLVDRLERWKISRWIGAAAILLGLGGAFGWTGYSLAGSASELVDSLPVAAQKLRLALRTSSRATDANTLDTVQKAAAQLEQAAEENSAKVAARKGVARVVIERPSFNVRDYMWSGTVGLISAAGQLTLVAFLTFFALGSGDTFRRKLVKITGPSLQKKKITVHVLDDITGHIERYLLVQILTSALVGVATGLAFWGLGLENAAVWGIVAAVTNLIPYIGSVIVMAAAGLVAFLQFNGIQMALLVGGTSLVIHTLVGNLLVPFLTSKTSRMNPVAVFVGVIFWGWLWGIWGLLLGIPILMVVKAVCDHVEDLQPIGELLGD